MNKAQDIQRSKLITAYGGVGSIIDTIDNLSYEINEFDRWPIYRDILENPNTHGGLVESAREERLIERLKNIGFTSLTDLFLTEEKWPNDLNLRAPTEGQKKNMVSASYFPRMFYCPRCGRIQDINIWEEQWKHRKWDSRPPKCAHCSEKKVKNVYGPNLIQVRFILASLETGDERDIPWNLIYAKKGTFDGTQGVWDFVKNPVEAAEGDVTFKITNNSSDLRNIYVKANGVTVTMAEIMNHYFILNYNGRPAAYKPVVRSANNVYFPYVIKSVYIPKKEISQEKIDKIREKSTKWEVEEIAEFVNLPIEQVRTIIDNGFNVAPTNYATEEAFRQDEFDCLTNDSYYKRGVFTDNQKRLISEKYVWQGDESISFIKQIYLLKRINVTSALVAYSRIDKIGISCLSQWKGKSEHPKQWYDIERQLISDDVDVALHPICRNKEEVKMFPVVSQYGEGFFIEFDNDRLPREENEKEIFIHTFSHLVMKALEFTCGYPISSMNERLYILPTSKTDEEADRYGIMIYSANGEAGSYGGITSLFETRAIEKILQQAIDSASDCPNDPICEGEGGSCFACVQIPDIACEMFNSKLSRNVILDWQANNQ